jgi:hypothetical protein
MKNAKKYLRLIATIILLSFVACNNDDDDNTTPTPTPTSNVIEVTANIENATTWETGKVYIIKKWDFYVDNTLTIQPGVIVKFHPTLGPDLTLGNAGTIIANGTSASPVIFTSYKDDINGGDNNGDGTATTPAKNDWGTISMNGLSGSVFNYCKFYYSGINHYAALEIPVSSNATVTNCTFAHNDGFYADGGALDASDAGASSVIQNNVFYDNVKALSVNCRFSLDNSNSFHNPDNVLQTNTYNAIFVESTDHIDAPISWLEDEVAYVINDNDLWINSTLTLGDNVVLKFMPSSVIVLNNGANPIINYNGTNVYFTSYKDDSLKGDSNGDASITTSANGDWGGIYDNITSAYVGWTNILYDSY